MIQFRYWILGISLEFKGQSPKDLEISSILALLSLRALGLGGCLGCKIQNLAPVVPATAHADAMAPMPRAAILALRKARGF